MLTILIRLQVGNHIFHLVYLLSRDKKNNYEAITTTIISFLYIATTACYAYDGKFDTQYIHCDCVACTKGRPLDY